MLDWLRKGREALRDEELPITEHLAELRDRLLYSTLAIVICAIGGFYFAREIIAFLMYPLKRAMVGLPITAQLHFTSITEPLFQSFKIALFAGIAFAFPFWIWQAWKFVAPGLYSNERRLVLPFILSSTGLFLIGTTFAYTIAVPLAYRFLLLYANPYEQKQDKGRNAGIRLEIVPLSRTKETKQIAPPKSPFQITLEQPRRGGLRLKIQATKPAFQWTPDAILDALSKHKTLRLQWREGPKLRRYQLRYRWPKQREESAAAMLKPILTLQAYLSVSSWFLLGFGLIFQTPLIIILLTSSGLISAKTLGEYRRHAFIVILVIAAILTPTGDPINLMIMALPMYILYEIGLWVSRILAARKHAPSTTSGDSTAANESAKSAEDTDTQEHTERDSEESQEDSQDADTQKDNKNGEGAGTSSAS